MLGTLLLWLLAGECLFAGLVAADGASSDLRGLPFLLYLALLTVTLDGLIGYAWGRWPARFRWAGQVLGIVVISLTGAALSLDLVNRQEGFYASFSDLIGSPQSQSLASAAPPPTQARLDILTSNWQRRGIVAARAGHGVVLDARYFGERSGIVRRGYVYLPAAYFTGPQSLHFPVIELLHGQPGGPPNVIRQLGAPALLDAQIAAHRMPPTIAVIPATWTHTFTECVDAVHGEADETYLSVDVPNDVYSSLRAIAGRTWAIAGYSTGGFCAVNLALHHPDRYSVAASLSGYFTAAQDPHTARLYGGSAAALRRNSPNWWITHRAPVAPALYLFASRQDAFAFTQLQQFEVSLKTHDPALPTASFVLPSGGHNWNVWKAGLKPALDWMAQYLPMPLEQPEAADGR